MAEDDIAGIYTQDSVVDGGEWDDWHSASDSGATDALAGAIGELHFHDPLAAPADDAAPTVELDRHLLSTAGRGHGGGGAHAAPTGVKHAGEGEDAEVKGEDDGAAGATLHWADDVEEDDADDDGYDEVDVRDGEDDGMAGEEDDDEYDEEDDEFDELPEHACSYCDIHKPDSVVQCVAPGCGRWFCNSSEGSRGSHAVMHMVHNRHKQLQLHEDSPLKNVAIECYNCGSRNVFLLGFIQAKTDAVAALLCREPCLALRSLGEVEWDLDCWQPLIQDRRLLTWLVKPPSRKELMRSREVTTGSIRRLEELWKSNPHAVADDVDDSKDEEEEEEEEVDPMQLSYASAVEYRSILQPLVDLEAEEDRRVKEAQTQENISVTWSVGMHGQAFARFYFARAPEELRVSEGDELRLVLPASFPGGGDWDETGVVTRLYDGEVTLQMRLKGSPPPSCDGYVVHFVWKSVSYDRMNKAMTDFATSDSAVSSYLYAALLGQEQPEKTLRGPPPPVRISVRGLPTLNPSQMDAVRRVLTQPVSLIQGPPGTGKTVTSATLVYHLVQRARGALPILVCAPSNVAVDQLAAKISLTGVKVVRVCAKSREQLSTSVDALSLHVMVRELAEMASGELEALMKKRKLVGSLARHEMRRLARLKKSAEGDILAKAEVICATCAGAGDRRLARFRFRHVLIDEATQATEPEVLIPLVRGARQVIMVGDHQQLGPVIVSNKAAAAGLTMSMFERLIMLGQRPIRLAVQYRMHPCLSLWPSTSFYEGTLQNGVTAAERESDTVRYPWPDPTMPMMFYACTGMEEIGRTGVSYLNRQEAAMCVKVVARLLAGGATAKQIGVITPYEGQRAWITQTLTHSGVVSSAVAADVEVASVDSFQGREKDYIILSCVRSNTKQGIGFLNQPRRLNVAITRSRYGLVILGNPRVLGRYELWHRLISHYIARRLLVTGPLDMLSVSRMILPQPRRKWVDRRSRLAAAAEAKVDAWVAPAEELFEADLAAADAGTADDGPAPSPAAAAPPVPGSAEAKAKTAEAAMAAAPPGMSPLAYGSADSELYSAHYDDARRPLPSAHELPPTLGAYHGPAAGDVPPEVLARASAALSAAAAAEEDGGVGSGLSGASQSSLLGGAYTQPGDASLAELSDSMSVGSMSQDSDIYGDLAGGGAGGAPLSQESASSLKDEPYALPEGLPPTGFF